MSKKTKPTTAFFFAVIVAIILLYFGCVYWFFFAPRRSHKSRLKDYGIEVRKETANRHRTGRIDG